MSYQALFAYKATGEGEVGLTEGEKLTVLQQHGMHNDVPNLALEQQPLNVDVAIGWRRRAW
jgi:hypothetical protein